MALRFRPSEIGNICQGLSKQGLTDVQKKTLDELLSKIKLTDKQAITRDELIAKRDAEPQLSTGGETYVREIVEKYLYSYSDRLETRPMTKGIEAEQEGIEYLNSQLFTNYTKFPEGIYENEWLISVGCDIKQGTITRDIKLSWSKKTHPKTWQDAYNSTYEWQGRAYMMLFDTMEHYVDHLLIDTPDELIGYEDKSMHKMYNLTYEQRHTSIRFMRDSAKEEILKLAVKLARIYATEYEEILKTNTKNY